MNELEKRELSPHKIGDIVLFGDDVVRGEIIQVRTDKEWLGYHATVFDFMYRAVTGPNEQDVTYDSEIIINLTHHSLLLDEIKTI